MYWTVEGPNLWAILYVQWFQRRSFEAVRPGRKPTRQEKNECAKARHNTWKRTHAQHTCTPRRAGLVVDAVLVKPLSAVYYVTSTTYAFPFPVLASVNGALYDISISPRSLACQCVQFPGALQRNTSDLLWRCGSSSFSSLTRLREADTCLFSLGPCGPRFDLSCPSVFIYLVQVMTSSRAYLG